MKNRPLLNLGLGLLALLATVTQAQAASPAVELKTELDYETLHASGEDTAIIKVSLRPNRPLHKKASPPINLAIVLDRSGSMSGAKIEMAKKAVIEAFDSLRSGDRVSIISYSNTVETLLPLTPVRHIRNPRSYIERIFASGGTAIYSAVNQAAAELRPETEDFQTINRILLLSDGLANQGPSRPYDFKMLGRSLSREGITVSTIGLGLDYNEDLMAGLSAEGQGNVYFVESAYDLPRIFESELGDASSIVAHDAVIELECLEGFAPIRIIGREGNISGNRVRIEISQLYAEKEKFALIEVRNPGGKPGQSKQVATIEARIQLLDTDEEYVQHSTTEAYFTDDQDAYKKSVNIAVQRDLVANKIALAKEEAIAFADQGELDKATQQMSQLNSWIYSKNFEWKDDEIAETAAVLDYETEQLEEHGMDKRARKEMRASSYQIRSQQPSK